MLLFLKSMGNWQRYIPLVFPHILQASASPARKPSLPDHPFPNNSDQQTN
jgi:hypothetical protein